MKNPSATLEWITLYHTLSKNRETRSTNALIKRSWVIFTCLTARTIHIELAEDLSTHSFLLVLKRLISRRHYVKIKRSDNDTNFVVANNESNLCIKQPDQIKLHKFGNHQNIEQIFNSHESPWMRGVWESLVKSVKTGLKAIVKDIIYMYTLFLYKQRFFSTQSQCCLNSSWIELQLLRVD